MAVRTAPSLKAEARKLWIEAKELHLIFSKIWRSGKMKGEILTMITPGMRSAIRASSLFRHSSLVIRHYNGLSFTAIQTR
jgi:hypothetical protein